MQKLLDRTLTECRPYVDLGDVAIYSPSLDKKGNSIAGIKVLEKLSAELDLSIF